MKTSTTLKGTTLVVSGLLFGLGLVVSGMTQPSKVIGFLNFFGAWDPSLAMVMLGAIGVHFVAYRLIMKRPSPYLAEAFRVPTRSDIDKKLVLGSMLFGMGWGLAGYCPGPALTSLTAGEPQTLVFVLAMVFGMVVYGRLNLGTSTGVGREVQGPQQKPHQSVPTN